VVEKEEFGQRLIAAMAEVPDPRSRHGRRHPLPAILTLSVAAMLAGARTELGIAEWGRVQDAATVRALGFTRTATPCLATLHLLFKRLDVVAFEAAIGEWAQETLGGDGEAIAIDGKGLRGIHGEELPGVRLVAAYSDRAGLVLALSGSPGSRTRAN
jgi:hypothetical protein